MRELSVSGSQDRKKYVFYDTAKRQVDLRVRLQYDGMNQSKFFRAMITGYLEKDARILAYLDKYKSENEIQGINKRLGSKRLAAQGAATVKDFSLNKNDIEDIFDILEKEHPDL